MTITAHEILTKARELVAKPGGWTQGEFGRDKDGLRAVYSSPAVSFCAYGACIEAAAKYDGADTRVWASATDALTAQIKKAGVSITVWNDTPGRTQAEVVELFDKAIASVSP